MLKAVGSGINKLRRMSSDLRNQSGIDEIIRDEGLREDLEALRSLRNMSRGRIVDTLVEQAMKEPKSKSLAAAAAGSAVELAGEEPERKQEYPEIGADSYDALAEDSPYALDGDGLDDDGLDDHGLDDHGLDDDGLDQSGIADTSADASAIAEDHERESDASDSAAGNSGDIDTPEAL